MSYYMGDYYAGDPGFFSFLGGLAKTAVGFIPGVGPSLSAGLSAITHKAAPAAAGMAVSAAKPGFFRGATQAVRAGVLKHPVLSGAGAAGIAGAVAGAGAERLLGRGRGKCKHTYVNARGEVKCRRRMRVTNPKALRRAIRRTSGFAKLAMRTIHIVHPRKKGRFGGFKARRKR